MAKDLVCGNEIPEQTTYHTTYEDREYYFCSDRCLRTFAVNPLKFLDASKSATSLEGRPKADG